MGSILILWVKGLLKVVLLIVIFYFVLVINFGGLLLFFGFIGKFVLFEVVVFVGMLFMIVLIFGGIIILFFMFYVLMCVWNLVFWCEEEDFVEMEGCIFYFGNVLVVDE